MTFNDPVVWLTPLLTQGWEKNLDIWVNDSEN
jgi:hypothetical protein